jgi:hypothetical protein
VEAGAGDWVDLWISIVFGFFAAGFVEFRVGMAMVVVLVGMVVLLA